MKKLEVVVHNEPVRLSASTAFGESTRDHVIVKQKREGKSAAPAKADPFFEVKSPRARDGDLITVTACI